MIRLLKIQRTQATPWKLVNTLVARENNWDDFGFKTTFHLALFDSTGKEYEIGEVKIGYVNQDLGWTSHKLPSALESGLPDGFFSLGQSAEYYLAIAKSLPKGYAKAVLKTMRDVVADRTILQKARENRVFENSLLRFTSLSAIEQQFPRILSGGAELTSFDFSFSRDATNRLSDVNLSFSVKPLSTPPTNVHVLIGRNGVGKTTILNDMARAATADEEALSKCGRFLETSPIHTQLITRSSNYFSSVTSISFSAFDPFEPPADQPDRSKGTCYFYVGLKSNDVPATPSRDVKSPTSLRKEFVKSLAHCFSLQTKRAQWVHSLELLESDPNFAAMELPELANKPASEVTKAAERAFGLMSSGHAVVLLSITRLVETVDEKSLILIDEPESHLHPPLLAAFMRALSDLLKARNGVAIVATHSPVVLQEVPKSCVWKLRRSRMQFASERPDIETFGENVGVLTREVFGLEVSKSGYHSILSEAASQGRTFEQIMTEFDNNIGLEGQALLRVLTSTHGEVNQ